MSAVSWIKGYTGGKIAKEFSNEEGRQLYVVIYNAGNNHGKEVRLWPIRNPRLSHRTLKACLRLDARRIPTDPPAHACCPRDSDV